MGEVLVLDVGNTHLHWSRWQADQCLDSGRVPVVDVDDWQDRLSKYSGVPTVIGSVGVSGRSMAEFLQRSGHPVQLLERGDAFPLDADVAEVQTVGVDRLAGALGAFELSQAAAITADVGTAITVDWIDSHGVFRGGAIVPGRRLALRALSAGTLQLPELSLWGTEVIQAMPGRDTQGAIRAGVDVGQVGLIERLIESLRELAGPSTACWLTGGDAEWFLARTRLPVHHEPLLVARGLKAAGKRLAENGA